MGGNKKEIKMEKSEMTDLSTTILKELHARYDFVPVDRADISVSQIETAGLLLRVFLAPRCFMWVD